MEEKTKSDQVSEETPSGGDDGAYPWPSQI